MARHVLVVGVLMALFGLVPSFASFGEWQTATPRAGDQPGDNWDGDFFDDLMEYALGSDPASGQPLIAATPAERAGLRLSISPSGSVTASVWKPLDVTDVGYALERSTNLVQWSTVPGGAITASNGGQLLSWADVNAGRPTGFVRLRITLPGTTPTISRTPPQGWVPVSFAPGTQSYGLTLLPDQLYASTAYTTGGNHINVTPSETRDLRALFSGGSPAFLEFADSIAGIEGHRIEIDVAAMASSTDPRRLVLNLASSRNTTATLPSGLEGVRFVVRQHDLLGDTFPKEYFKGTMSPPTADTVRLWTGTAWQNYWLLDERPVNPAGRHCWVRSGDATLADQGGLVLPPSSGCLLLRRGTTPVTILETGELRPWCLRRVLLAGTHFLAGSYPLDQTASGLGLSTAGFLPGTSPAASAQFQVWQGDTSTSTPSYLTAWLYASVTTPYWVLTNDATLSDVSGVSLFRASRGHFEVPKQAVNYLAPLPAGVTAFPLAVNPMHDSDTDGLPDSWELRYYGSVGAISGNDDLDGDYFAATSEFFALTSPVTADSDGDLWDDGQEAEIGSDPRSNTSTPLSVRPSLEAEAISLQSGLNSFLDTLLVTEFVPKVEGLNRWYSIDRSSTGLKDELGDPLAGFPERNEYASGVGEAEYPDQNVPPDSLLNEVAWRTDATTTHAVGYHEVFGPLIAGRGQSDRVVALDNEVMTTFQQGSSLGFDWRSFRLVSTVRFPYPITISYTAGVALAAFGAPEEEVVYFGVHPVTLTLPAGRHIGLTSVVPPVHTQSYYVQLVPAGQTEMVPANFNSRDKFLAGSLHLPDDGAGFSVEITGPGTHPGPGTFTFGATGNTTILPNLEAIQTQLDYYEAHPEAEPPLVWFVANNRRSGVVDIYTCFDHYGEVEIRIRKQSALLQTLRHTLVPAPDFAEWIAFVDGWAKGDYFQFDENIVPRLLAAGGTNVNTFSVGASIGGPVHRLTTPGLIPIYTVMAQVEGAEALLRGALEGVVTGLNDDWEMAKLVVNGLIAVGNFAAETTLAELRRWRESPGVRMAQMHSMIVSLQESLILGPSRALGEALGSWENFKEASFSVWARFKGAARKVAVIGRDFSGRMANGFAEWSDDFVERMIDGGERAAWVGAPWNRNDLAGLITAGNRTALYSLGYMGGYCTEQVAVGALTGGVIKLGAIVLKGGTVLAGQLTKRVVASTAARLQLGKIAVGAGLPQALHQAIERGLAKAAQVPLSPAILDTPIEIIERYLQRPGINRATWNFRAILDQAVAGPNLRSLFLREGGEHLFNQRFALFAQLMGDHADEVTARHFIRILEQKLIVLQPEGFVDEWAEDFIRAFKGSATDFVQRPPMTGLSETAIQRLKNFVGEPFPGYVWKWEEDITDDWKEPVVRGILCELDLWQRLYRGQGFTHFPGAAAVDFVKGAEAIQLKSIGVVNQSTLARMRKALDDMVAYAIQSQKSDLHLDIRKKPGIDSAQLEQHLRDHIVSRRASGDYPQSISTNFTIAEYEFVPKP